MRWLGLLLAIPAAVAGYYVAHKARVFLDRRPTPGFERSQAVERHLKAFEGHARGREAPPQRAADQAAEGRDDPWLQFIAAAKAIDGEVLERLVLAHRNTPIGARAMLQWIRRAASDEETAVRRAAFARAYPESWILGAWQAEASR